MKKKYVTIQSLNLAWHTNVNVTFGKLSVPKPHDAVKDPQLLDFQHFREDIADESTSRQVAAIKSADPESLTTVGCLQTTVPSRYWGGIADFTGFVPKRQARYLDFLEIHFYPSEFGGYEYRSRAHELGNLRISKASFAKSPKPANPSCWPSLAGMAAAKNRSSTRARTRSLPKNNKPNF